MIGGVHALRLFLLPAQGGPLLVRDEGEGGLGHALADGTFVEGLTVAVSQVASRRVAVQVARA